MINRPKLILIFVLALIATGLFQLIKTFTEIVWPNYLVLIHSVQQGYHTMLLDAVKQAQIEPVTASLTLVGLSFLYGIFHAAGPGHGKVVISTYLLSTGDQLRRGVMLSFSSSLLQGITAISVVTGATWILNYSMRTTQLLIDDVELGSFVLIAAAGCLIIGLRLKNIFSRLWHRQASDAHIISDDTHEHCSRSVAEREGVFGQYLFFDYVFNRASSLFRGGYCTAIRQFTEFVLGRLAFCSGDVIRGCADHKWSCSVDSLCTASGRTAASS